MNLFRKHIDSLLVLGGSLLIFTFIMLFVPTDMHDHITEVQKINVGKADYPMHFLFFGLINLLSGFTSELKLLYGATILILSFSVFLKYNITKQIFGELSIDRGKAKLWSVGLLFFFALPDFYNVFVIEQFYLGRIPANVWHNSTTIMLFPFALLLFWKQYKVLRENHVLVVKDVLVLCALVLLNIYIKPSFLMVYVPVVFAMLLIKWKVIGSGKVMKLSLPLFLAIGGGVLAYLFIYQSESSLVIQSESSVVLSVPFEAFGKWLPDWYVPIAIGMSFVLPIFTIAFYREILKYKPFQWAGVFCVVGLIISAFVIESGPRSWHGNFLWQNIICCYMLMLSTLAFMLPKFYDEKEQTIQLKILKVLAYCHVIAGVLYLIKMGVTGSYY